MNPFRIAVLVSTVFLVVMCVWVVVRLISEIGRAVARGLRALVSSDSYPGLSPGPRNSCYSGSGRSASLLDHHAPGLPGASSWMCARRRCRWVNRPAARFCAQCGQPLTATAARRAV